MVDELIEQLVRKQMREDPPPTMVLQAPEFRAG